MSLIVLACIFPLLNVNPTTEYVSKGDISTIKYMGSGLNFTSSEESYLQDYTINVQCEEIIGNNASYNINISITEFSVDDFDEFYAVIYGINESSTILYFLPEKNMSDVNASGDIEYNCSFSSEKILQSIVIKFSTRTIRDYSSTIYQHYVFHREESIKTSRINVPNYNQFNATAEFYFHGWHLTYNYSVKSENINNNEFSANITVSVNSIGDWEQNEKIKTEFGDGSFWGTEHFSSLEELALLGNESFIILDTMYSGLIEEIFIEFEIFSFLDLDYGFGYKINHISEVDTYAILPEGTDNTSNPYYTTPQGEDSGLGSIGIAFDSFLICGLFSILYIAIYHHKKIRRSLK